jgi:hypothetical protein
VVEKMDLAKAMIKPFTDIKNLIIGIALSILPIVRWFAAGYLLESSGLGKHKPSHKLNEWDDWGDLFLKGLSAWLIGLVYMIPALIILLVGATNLIMSLVNVYIGKIIPSGMIGAVVAGDAKAEALLALLQNNWAAAIPSLLAFAPVVLVALLLGLFASYLIPAAVLTYLSGKGISDAFSIRKVFGKAFKGEYLLAWIIVLLINLILGAILGWIPVVGGAAHYFIAGTISFTLFGEVYSRLR